MAVNPMTLNSSLHFDNFLWYEFLFSKVEPEIDNYQPHVGTVQSYDQVLAVTHTLRPGFRSKQSEETATHEWSIFKQVWWQRSPDLCDGRGRIPGIKWMAAYLQSLAPWPPWKSMSSLIFLNIFFCLNCQNRFCYLHLKTLKDLHDWHLEWLSATDTQGNGSLAGQLSEVAGFEGEVMII